MLRSSSDLIFFLINPTIKKIPSFLSPPAKMEKNSFWASWVPPLFFLLQTLTAEAALTVSAGIGVGIGIGNGGGGGGIGVGIGGGGGPTPAPSGSPSSTLKDAYRALQAWKSAIIADPSGVLASWVGPNVCSYRGVFCADFQGDETAVAGIDLNGANLKGTLVRELSLLTDMTLLHLHSNRFSGTVPETFRDLSSLQELDLSNNLLSGPFPRPLLLVPNLLFLDLRFNSFSGPIPQELFVKHLDAILINNNNFEGQIPSTLGNSPASVINLANNRFSGNLPTSFAYMNYGLKEILLLNNKLTGCIPEGVGFLTNMEVLDASYNQLTGHLPKSLSCLSEIEVLNVAHNRLSGLVPEVVCSLRNLVNLTVAYNFFSGFGQECGKVGGGFDFSSNCVPGQRLQRPGQDCSAAPGDGGSCLRAPSVEALVCGSLGN